MQSSDESIKTKSLSSFENTQGKRFDGFRNTPFLWQGLLEGLQMYQPQDFSLTSYPEIDSSTHIRLGKLVEEFVWFELGQDKNTQLLQSNVQIFRNRITIGELDCLVKQKMVNIHLEIVYKFYLYDSFYTSELDRWIGPNRKDSFVLKLHKLKEKQLPLLYHPESAKTLEKLNLSASNFNQQVYFKTQLFVPYHKKESTYPLINNDCIKGFYLRKDDLELFPNHTFYIPPKLDWLVEPHQDVAWHSASSFQQSLSGLLGDRKSPLCWMRSDTAEMKKFFVVWWE